MYLCVYLYIYLFIYYLSIYLFIYSFKENKDSRFTIKYHDCLQEKKIKV